MCTGAEFRPQLPAQEQLLGLAFPFLRNRWQQADAASASLGLHCLEPSVLTMIEMTSLGTERLLVLAVMKVTRLPPRDVSAYICGWI